jgi:O-antigen/teichoic acid export membrane protein
MKDLKQRTLQSGVVKLCAQGVNFLLRLGSLVVLARLLDPKDFGIVGMVTAVTGIFALFKDAGLSLFTIQRPTISNEEVSTLFWLNILVGTLLTLLCLAAAPLLVTFYNEPRLFWVTVVLATGFLINAAGVQHSALLQREIRFGVLSAVEIVSQVASALVGIGLAMEGLGYWALVGSAVVLPAVSTLGVWVSSAWVPGIPKWSVGSGRMIRFGGMAMLNSLIMYVSYNLDKVLLGRFWGAEALGIYGRAFQLISIPSDNLTQATGGVLFSALSRLQDDPNRWKKYFLTSYSVMLSLTLPVTIACALFADDIIIFVLGPKWKDAVIIFQMLTPTILVLAMISPTYWLLVSIGRAERSLKIACILGPLVIGAYVLGLPYGPRGVAFAYSAVLVLWLVPHMVWCIHDTIISWRDILKASGQPFLSAIVGGAVAFVAQLFYGQSFSPFFRLLLGGGVLLLTYLWMLLYVMGRKELYVDIFRGLMQRSSGVEKPSVAVP